MTAEGWFDDGSGRERWWDGSQWTDRYRAAETVSAPVEAPAVAGSAPLRVFPGRRAAGSIELRVFETFVEFEHQNFFVAMPIEKIVAIGYSRTSRAVTIAPDIEFSSDDAATVYEYLRARVLLRQ